MERRATDDKRWFAARPRTILIAIAVASMVTYVALPGATADVFFQFVEWMSIAAFVYGIRRNGGFSLPWIFIGIGWVSFALGDLLFTLYDHVFNIAPFPSPADLFYLAGYPFMASGLAALVRRSRPDGDRIALIDASIVVVPLAVASWIYLIEPYSVGGGSTLTERAVSGAYPLGDLLLLVVLIRLFAGPSATRRSAEPAMSIFGVGLLTMLVADVWFVATQLHGSYVVGGWNDALYLVPYLCAAGAALCPSVRNIGRELPRTDPSLGSRRLAMLAIAALVTPGILIIEWSIGDELAVPLIVMGTAVSFLLVITRMASLVDALEGSRAELAYDATHDHLTGLANRSLFARDIDATLTGGGAGSLLFIDLDNFKRVNDRFGHDAGDQMLVKVADRLRAAVRTSDIVARLSGDEFGVLLPDADSSIAEALAERLVERLAMAAGEDESVPVTASIGTVSWSDSAVPASAHAVLVEADRAMYRAKAADGNRYAIAGAG